MLVGQDSGDGVALLNKPTSQWAAHTCCCLQGALFSFPLSRSQPQTEEQKWGSALLMWWHHRLDGETFHPCKVLKHKIWDVLLILGMRQNTIDNMWNNATMMLTGAIFSPSQQEELGNKKKESKGWWDNYRASRQKRVSITWPSLNNRLLGDCLTGLPLGKTAVTGCHWWYKPW